MEWNNGKERAKFEQEQKKLREEYLALGMTEEQIHELYILDLEWFNSQRTKARHTHWIMIRFFLFFSLLSVTEKGIG